MVQGQGDCEQREVIRPARERDAPAHLLDGELAERQAEAGGERRRMRNFSKTRA
jgi:hypothetical protein